VLHANNVNPNRKTDVVVMSTNTNNGNRKTDVVVMTATTNNVPILKPDVTKKITRKIAATAKKNVTLTMTNITRKKSDVASAVVVDANVLTMYLATRPSVGLFKPF